MFKKFLISIQNTGMIILFPILMYLAFCFFDGESSIILTSIIYYLMLLFLVFFFMLFQTEKIVYFLDNRSGKLIFLKNMILFIIFISLTFASFYWVIYDYDNQSFLNVISGNRFEIYLDFAIYSLGVFLINNNSEIMPNTLYSKLFVSTEILSSFTTIVLILANLKELKNPFNEHLEKK